MQDQAAKALLPLKTNEGRILKLAAMVASRLGGRHVTAEEVHLPSPDTKVVLIGTVLKGFCR